VTPLDATLLEAVKDLRERGASYSKIASELGVPIATAHSYATKARECECGCGSLTSGTYARGHFPREGESDRSFWRNVRKQADGDCWDWVGPRDRDGYGISGAGEFGPTRAHRRSYLIAFGHLPTGRWVLHRCDNPACVNPAHLTLGDPKKNARERQERKREVLGERHHNAKLTDRQVREVRDLCVRGWVHQDIADAFGSSQTNVSRIARGEARVTA
jgi:hypothetical protein